MRSNRVHASAWYAAQPATDIPDMSDEAQQGRGTIDPSNAVNRADNPVCDAITALESVCLRRDL
jgi:hypothetical protein